MRAVQIQQRRRLHAIDARPGRRAPWPWRVRLVVVAAWLGLVCIGTFVVAFVLTMGYGLWLLGQNFVHGAGW